MGWFQGRMECGPRALGNRSILASPVSVEIRDRVNREVKHRELWRPLAPTVLAEHAPEYFEVDRESPFMLLATKVRKERRKEVAGVTHVDGTARPQTLEKRVNQRYYALIESFESITGVPMVLNTSFNDRGEPLVCTPQEAIRDFLGTGLDALAIGDFLVKKKGV